MTAVLEPITEANTSILARRVNVELLNATLQHIIDHPEEWDQHKWFCGTTACFAGHAALIHGAKVDERFTNSDGHYMVQTSLGGSRSIKEYAQDILGLDYWQGGLLFSAVNTLEDLKMLVQGYSEGKEYSELRPLVSWSYENFVEGMMASL